MWYLERTSNGTEEKEIKNASTKLGRLIIDNDGIL